MKVQPTGATWKGLLVCKVIVAGIYQGAHWDVGCIVHIKPEELERMS